MWRHYNGILGAPEKQRLNLSVWAGREWCCLAEAQPVSLTCAWQLQGGFTHSVMRRQNQIQQSTAAPPPRPTSLIWMRVLPKNSVSSQSDQNESAAIRASNWALKQYGDRYSGVCSFLLNTPTTGRAEQVIPEEVPLKRTDDCTS